MYHSKSIPAEPFKEFLKRRRPRYSCISLMAEEMRTTKELLEKVMDGTQTTVQEHIVDKAVTGDGTASFEELYPYDEYAEVLM